MYYPFFLTYIITGVTIGFVVFVWALKNGQFSQQQRARFLALENQSEPVMITKKNRLELVAILIAFVVGIVSSFAAVGYAIISRW